jgi:hypothetical protein
MSLGGGEFRAKPPTYDTLAITQNLFNYLFYPDEILSRCSSRRSGTHLRM